MRSPIKNFWPLGTEAISLGFSLIKVLLLILMSKVCNVTQINNNNKITLVIGRFKIIIYQEIKSFFITPIIFYRKRNLVNIINISIIRLIKHVLNLLLNIKRSKIEWLLKISIFQLLFEKTKKILFFSKRENLDQGRIKISKFCEFTELDSNNNSCNVSIFFISIFQFLIRDLLQDFKILYLLLIGLFS